MKKRKSALTPKLRQNWWIDILLGVGAVLALFSSIYFLVYPVSGYQGGRNPDYGKVLVFSRTAWDLIHTWSGVMMISAALLHVIIHWKWITGTVARTWQVITRKRDGFGFRLTYNILLDATIAICFIFCSITGIYFMFNVGSGPNAESFLFSKTTWDMLHTWSGVSLSIAAILHVVLHWKWIKNITSKMFGSRRMKSNSGQAVLEPAE
jgi:hypothetical protein